MKRIIYILCLITMVLTLLSGCTKNANTVKAQTLNMKTFLSHQGQASIFVKNVIKRETKIPILMTFGL